MAKKFTVSTRLANIVPPKPKPLTSPASRKLGLLSKKTHHPTSFRFNDDSLEQFKDLVEGVNNLSRRKVTETMVLQALIYMGTKAKPAKVLQIIKTIV